MEVGDAGELLSKGTEGHDVIQVYRVRGLLCGDAEGADTGNVQRVGLDVLVFHCAEKLHFHSISPVLIVLLIVETVRIPVNLVENIVEDRGV